jgi:hypothetical protein
MSVIMFAKSLAADRDRWASLSGDGNDSRSALLLGADGRLIHSRLMPL